MSDDPKKQDELEEFEDLPREYQPSPGWPDSDPSLPEEVRREIEDELNEFEDDYYRALKEALAEEKADDSDSRHGDFSKDFTQPS